MGQASRTTKLLDIRRARHCQRLRQADQLRGKINPYAKDKAYVQGAVTWGKLFGCPACHVEIDADWNASANVHRSFYREGKTSMTVYTLGSPPSDERIEDHRRLLQEQPTFILKNSHRNPLREECHLASKMLLWRDAEPSQAQVRSTHQDAVDITEYLQAYRGLCQ